MTILKVLDAPRLLPVSALLVITACASTKAPQEYQPAVVAPAYVPVYEPSPSMRNAPKWEREMYKCQALRALKVGDRFDGTITYVDHADFPDSVNEHTSVGGSHTTYFFKCEGSRTWITVDTKQFGQGTITNIRRN